MHAVNSDGGIEREREAEKLEENTEPDARAPFQKSADRERQEKCPDEHEDRDGRPLRFKQRRKHLFS